MTNERLIQKSIQNIHLQNLHLKKTGRSSINIMVLTVTQEMEEAEDVGRGRRGGWLNRVSMDIRQVTLKGLVHSIKHWMHLRGRHKMGVYKKKKGCGS